MTAEQGMYHPWIVKNLAAKRKKSLYRKSTIEKKTFKRLQSFSNNSIMRKTILNCYVQFLKSEDVQDLRVQFEQIDKDHSGYISINELKEALKNSGIQEQESRINQIMNNLDYDNNNEINYTEFLASTVKITSKSLT